jgi:hypothetical protein
MEWDGNSLFGITVSVPALIKRYTALAKKGNAQTE